MPHAEIVTTNPNPNAMTLSFTDIPECFKPFDRLGIAVSDFSNASPFAKAVMETGRKDISRMDFVRRGHGGELSFVGRLPWASPRGVDPRPLQAFEGWTGKFLAETATIVQSFNQIALPDPARDLVILTNDVLGDPEVQGKLAKDGGDVLVVEVPYDKATNSFTVKIALLGSCSGCDQATLTTLKGIEDRLMAGTDGLKSNFMQNAPEGHPYRTVKFGGLKTTEIVGSFYSPHADYVPTKKKFLGIF